MPDWFHRFGDIPGVSYTTPDGIDRTRLPGYDEAPQVREARPQLQLDEWLALCIGCGKTWFLGELSRPGGSAEPAMVTAKKLRG